MKKLIILFVSVFVLGLIFQSCNNGKTYAELKKEEKEAIQRFIDKQGINVISFDKFKEQDSTTNLDKNEFVLFPENGVYMQIVQKGSGEILGDGRHVILARYVEEQINAEGEGDTLSMNPLGNNYPDPEEFMLTKQGDNMQASFTTSGAMYRAYNSLAVPGGWLIPFNYVKVGREIAGRSKVRLIVPHSEGQSNAVSYVYPCYYEITYQLY